MSTKPTCLVLVSTLVAVVGCATPVVPLDPFDRPYGSENALPSMDLVRCTPKNVDTPARLLSGTRPLYPLGENLSGRSGKADLEFEVASSGSVRVVNRKAQNNWFAIHAEIAMRDWKVQPAQRAGQAVPVVCKLSFNFTAY
jgi:hypothetical protein